MTWHPQHELVFFQNLDWVHSNILQTKPCTAWLRHPEINLQELILSREKNDGQGMLLLLILSSVLAKTRFNLFDMNHKASNGWLQFFSKARLKSFHGVVYINSDWSVPCLWYFSKQVRFIISCRCCFQYLIATNVNRKLRCDAIPHTFVNRMKQGKERNLQQQFQ